MEKHEQLVQEYSQALQGYIQQMKDAEANCKAAGDKEGMIREKVKGNVVDIFQKMLTVSYNNIYVKRQIPDFARYEQYPEKHEQFRAAYLDFFTKIPTPWREKAEKDKQFGKMSEYETEQVKLHLADEMRALFIEHYNRIFGV